VVQVVHGTEQTQVMVVLVVVNRIHKDQQDQVQLIKDSVVAAEMSQVVAAEVLVLLVILIQDLLAVLVVPV
jgi:hypothetical protein